MNDLVVRLSKEQEVAASIRPQPSVEGFKAALDRGYVHLMFTKTGTELGVRMDLDECDLKANYEAKKGIVKIVGKLVLNYVRVRCHATIDLATLKGKGRLEPLEELQPGWRFKQEQAAKETA